MFVSSVHYYYVEEAEYPQEAQPQLPFGIGFFYC